MDIQMTDIQLFQILRERMGDKEAQALVSFVDAKIKEANEQNLKSLATKEDLAKLETRMSQTVYLSGVGQFLAIIASMFVILKFMLGK